MKDYSMRNILIIDRQIHWRGILADALREQGFVVRVLEDYDYSPSVDSVEGHPPDLVIIGCARIGRTEEELINKILSDKRHLLVFSVSPLPLNDMRNIFLAGADDVVDKTYDPDRLTSIVKKVIERLEARDSYIVAEEHCDYRVSDEGK